MAENVSDFVIPELNDSTEPVSPIAFPAAARSKICWILECELEDQNAADEFVRNDGSWSVRKRTNTSDGEKVYFRCTKVKVRGLQCEAAIYMLLDATSARILVFRSGAAHNCDAIDNKSAPSLTVDMKKVIEGLCDRKCKPLEIMDHLCKMNVPMPKLYAVKNHMAAYKKIKFGNPTISVVELRNLLDKLTALPAESDAPYVRYDISPDAEYFRFFMTSKALIQNACVAVSFNADATYKLLWQGFPVLVVGTTDLNKKFHLIGVAVTTNEKEEDFRFMFDAVSKCAGDLLNVSVKPTTLVSDAAKAIQNAFKSTYGDDTTIIMCWAHMHKNVQKQVAARVRNKNVRDEIMKDIEFLQTLASETHFDIAMKLFLVKWENEKEFLDYFRDMWITQNPLWYEGAKQRVPSTNNALEATNRVFKDKFTFRERLSLGEFVHVLVNMIGQYSRRCVSDLVYAHAPVVPKAMWSATYAWTKLKGLAMPTEKNGDKYIVPIKSSEYNDAVPTVKSNWASLHEFEVFYKSVWIISSTRDDKWINATCTCPCFQKEFMCKHVLGVAVRMGQETIPDDAKCAVLGAKRKRGRPAKAKSALIVQ